MPRAVALLAAALVALLPLGGTAEAGDKNKNKNGFPLQLRSGPDGFSVQLGNSRLKVRLRDKRRVKPVAVAAAPRRQRAAPRNSIRPEARPDTVGWSVPGNEYAYGYEYVAYDVNETERLATLQAPEAASIQPTADQQAGDLARPDQPASRSYSDLNLASSKEPYEIDTSYVEHDAREIERVATAEGDVIAVGDRLPNGADRFSAVRDPALLGLPPVADSEVYLRVSNAAVRVESGTERVVAILELDQVVIE